jgi:hypothetical protein
MLLKGAQGAITKGGGAKGIATKAAGAYVAGRAANMAQGQQDGQSPQVGNWTGY